MGLCRGNFSEIRLLYAILCRLHTTQRGDKNYYLQLPSMEEYLDSLGNAKILSSLDVNWDIVKRKFPRRIFPKRISHTIEAFMN